MRRSSGVGGESSQRIKRIDAGVVAIGSKTKVDGVSTNECGPHDPDLVGMLENRRRGLCTGFVAAGRTHARGTQVRGPYLLDVAVTPRHLQGLATLDFDFVRRIHNAKRTDHRHVPNLGTVEDSVTITTRPGHPDFLDLPWDQPLLDWEHSRLVDLPKGISRHTVRFVQYATGIYVIKQLPTPAAERDFAMLRKLEDEEGPAVEPVGLVQNSALDPGAEESAALITRYLDYSFSYRELLSGTGFGKRRNQMLDAFAVLLVELHLIGFFWGDCSLSNVLYRYDAEEIQTVLVDAETSEYRETGLSDGQREEELDIMIQNVAGGMLDIAAAAGRDLDEADLRLGEDIAERYRRLWDEVNRTTILGVDERYRIQQRVHALNALGFDVADFTLIPHQHGSQLKLSVTATGRRHHRNRLRDLTGLRASEAQARQILSDLRYFEAKHPNNSDKAVNAVRWRVGEFEPWIDRVRQTVGDETDPIQAFCDILHHRYVISVQRHYDVGTEAAFNDWLESGRPGYEI